MRCIFCSSQEVLPSVLAVIGEALLPIVELKVKLLGKLKVKLLGKKEPGKISRKGSISGRPTRTRAAQGRHERALYRVAASIFCGGCAFADRVRASASWGPGVSTESVLCFNFTDDVLIISGSSPHPPIHPTQPLTVPPRCPTFPLIARPAAQSWYPRRRRE